MLENIKNQIVNKEIFYQEKFLNNIFSWNELEKLLNLRPFVNDRRFNVICNQHFNWPSQSWLSDINSFPPTLLLEIINKYTCYFSDGSRVNEKVNSICNEIESITGCTSDAHIFFNLIGNNSKSFGIHCDTSHNLILQIEGVTKFKVWNKYNFNLKSDRLQIINEEPVLDVILNPGDVIYVPKYFYHEALSITKRLSISFPHVESYDPPQDREWIRLT